MCLIAVWICFVITAQAAGENFEAVDYERRAIYHSPQTPGFTSWAGTWTMPDGSLMVCFTQATGPVEGRSRAPKEVQHKLTWPPAGRPGYDMTGLDLRNVHLRSKDGGKTWQQVSADPFKSCMNGITGEAQTALADGAIIRGVWGYYLPYNPELPKTGYLQRSTDGSKTWGEPEVLLDPARFSAWPKRIRVLRDGRLIVLGGVAYVPANSRTRAEYSGLFEPLLMVSDDKGKSWSAPIRVVPDAHRENWGGEEFDAAELPNGDLLCIFRRIAPFGQRREVRWQGILKKSGDGWIPGDVGRAPFPHSGHPDVLATREGPILHVATSGIHYTTDAGYSWQKLNVPGTVYYPRAIQADDGRIYIFGHVGGDDAYGKTDQSIVMSSFRLVNREAAPDDPDHAVESNGLLLNYDFSRGSLPDAEGQIKNLSRNDIDAVIRPMTATPPPAKRTGWLEHRVLQGDGRGCWVSRPAKIQTLRHPTANTTMPFGLVRMDNGELALQCSAEGKPTKPVIAFSRDDGDTWTDFIEIPGASGRPMLLTYHGGGTLSFVAGRRHFSQDYGRTWTDSVEHPPTRAGRPFHLEGNAWVDRNEVGKAKSILELGWHYAPGKKHPCDDATVVFRRSIDGGRSWIDELSPPQWKFDMQHDGKTWLRGVSEGAIVRAANGDLVAALRSDMPPSFFDGPHDDSLEGTAISISKDDGQTWSKLNILFYAGRHHANLQRLPNNDLVCTIVVRDDVDGLKLASDRRGCDALVSHDHGQTWNLDRRYEIDAYRYEREDGYRVDGKCGHIAAVALPDGHVVSAYGHYLKGAAVLIKWHPDARPATPVKRDLQDLDKFASSAILQQVARPMVDYEAKQSSLVLTGRAWIHVPLDERLAVLDKNGTIELILKPQQQGGMPILVACAARGVEGFRIAYDQRNIDLSNQVLYSDQRANLHRMEYSIQVAGESDPRPFTTDVQQIAYVMQNGHGTFYRDGHRFSHQRETGDRGSLFHYTVKKSGSSEKLLISIGALVKGAAASAPFQGEVYAIRIYDRPLTVEELRRNLTSSSDR
jgi:hypothetical protein